MDSFESALEKLVLMVMDELRAEQEEFDQHMVLFSDLVPEDYIGSKFEEDLERARLQGFL